MLENRVLGTPTYVIEVFQDILSTVDIFLLSAGNVPVELVHFRILLRQPYIFDIGAVAHLALTMHSLW